MTLLILAILTPTVPLVVLYYFARHQPKGTLDWFLTFVITGSVIEIFHVVGTWVFISYYLRYAFVVAFLAVAVYRFIKLRRGDIVTTTTRRGGTTTKILFAVLFAALAGLVYRGHMAPPNSVDLVFPLKGGKYCVIQGGSNFVTNPFHNFVDSEYSLDIVKLNRFGNRGNGVSPRDVEGYEIFGETVYSPCDGFVVTAVDTVSDNTPPRANALSPLGNHVVITSGATQIVIAHLMQASLMVSAGDSIARGQPIGRVGNSGYSNEPHLHLQVLLYHAGAGVPAEPLPITFEGRFVAINDIVTNR
jgi:hypothetical protein